jgi:hypothetical protein
MHTTPTTMTYTYLVFAHRRCMIYREVKHVRILNFSNFTQINGETSYDTNKQHTHILMNCDTYGWFKFMPTDEMNMYDATIDAVGIRLKRIITSHSKAMVCAMMILLERHLRTISSTPKISNIS